MTSMPASDPWTTDDILPDTKIERFGLELDRASFDRLGQALDRISDAERSAEIAGSAMRIF